MNDDALKSKIIQFFSSRILSAVFFLNNISDLENEDGSYVCENAGSDISIFVHINSTFSTDVFFTLCFLKVFLMGTVYIC